MNEFVFQDLLPLGKDETPYRLLTTDLVSTAEAFGQRFVRAEPELGPDVRDPAHRVQLALRPTGLLAQTREQPHGHCHAK